MSRSSALSNCINQLFYHRIGTSVINYCLANHDIPPLSVKEKGHILSTYFKRAPNYGLDITNHRPSYLNFLKVLKKKYAWSPTDTPIKACYNGASMGRSCSLFLYVFNPSSPRHMAVNNETVNMLGELWDGWADDAASFIKTEISKIRQPSPESMPSNVHVLKPKPKKIA